MIVEEICQKCQREVEEVSMCERCEEIFCEDCRAEFNQFTQIDYDCCESCADSNNQED